jgi:hypothetical protein
MTKNLILSCLAAFALVSLAGCSSDGSHTSTTDTSTATMSPDTKDMNHPGGNNSH